MPKVDTTRKVETVEEWIHDTVHCTYKDPERLGEVNEAKPESAGEGLADEDVEVLQTLPEESLRPAVAEGEEEVAELGFGLEGMARAARIPGGVHAPRRRATVMLCGNHSSGKSTFINWAAGQNVLETGIPVETRGFCLVTRGARKKQLTRSAATALAPHIWSALSQNPDLDAQDREDFERYFEVKCHTGEGNLGVPPESIDFIDTPGLVDGASYAFDPVRIITGLATSCDLILVFLDPMGKAYCTRTLDVIKSLQSAGDTHQKVRFVLSKIDTVGSARELTTLVAQVTENLQAKGNLRDTHGFDILTMHIPFSKDEAEGEGEAPAASPEDEDGEEPDGFSMRTKRGGGKASSFITGVLSADQEHNQIRELKKLMRGQVQERAQAASQRLLDDADAVLRAARVRRTQDDANRQSGQWWSNLRWFAAFPLLLLLALVSFSDALVSMASSPRFPASIRQGPYSAAVLDALLLVGEGVRSLWVAADASETGQLPPHTSRFLAYVASVGAAALIFGLAGCRVRRHAPLDPADRAVLEHAVRGAKAAHNVGKALTNAYVSDTRMADRVGPLTSPAARHRSAAGSGSSA